MVPVVPARGACARFGTGHSLHPTQARHLWRGAEAKRPVDRVVVEDSGLLTLTMVDGEVAHHWHHDPPSLREVLAAGRERPATVLAEPDLLVVGGLGVSVCALDRIAPCPVDPPTRVR